MTATLNQYQFVVNRLNQSIKTQQNLLDMVNWLSRYFYLQNRKNQIVGSVIKNGKTVQVVYINPTTGKLALNLKTVVQYVPSFEQYLSNLKPLNTKVRANTTQQQFELDYPMVANDLKILKSFFLKIFIKVKFYSY